MELRFFPSAVKIVIKQGRGDLLPTRDGAADPQLTVAKQPTEPFTAHELPQQLTLTEEYNSASKHRQLLHTLFLCDRHGCVFH